MRMVMKLKKKIKLN